MFTLPLAAQLRVDKECTLVNGSSLPSAPAQRGDASRILPDPSKRSSAMTIPTPTAKHASPLRAASSAVRVKPPDFLDHFGVWSFPSLAAPPQPTIATPLPTLPRAPSPNPMGAIGHTETIPPVEREVAELSSLRDFMEGRRDIRSITRKDAVAILIGLSHNAPCLSQGEYEEFVRYLPSHAEVAQWMAEVEDKHLAAWKSAGRKVVEGFKPRIMEE
jgi:hypothetical protein